MRSGAVIGGVGGTKQQKCLCICGEMAEGKWQAGCEGGSVLRLQVAGCVARESGRATCQLWRVLSTEAT